MMKKSMMKRLAVMSMAAVVAVGMVGCGSEKKSDAPAGDKTAKFALVSATTGGAAAYGEAIKNGVDLAVEEINKKAEAEKGYKINLVFEDTKGEKNEAINAMKKVIHKDNVLAVAGPMLSGEMFAAGPVAVQGKVVSLGTSTTAEGITDKLIVYKNIFQEDKIFAREEGQLAEQLEESKQKEFGQKYRVEKLTQEEIEMIKTEEFIKAKKEYMKEVR